MRITSMSNYMMFEGKPCIISQIGAIQLKIKSIIDRNNIDNEK